GHRGEVQRVIRKKHVDGTYDPNRVYVIVAGANLVIKHQRSTGRVRTQTGRIEMEAPIHISNVMLVGGDNKPTRVGYEVAANGEKARIDRRSGNAV
ncbi:MAG: 50S ribosomal protein L24, partial [Caldilineaceae bacterium]|nr:50S ribosomal protein L24 [Caldilineaceae bacterium]